MDTEKEVRFQVDHLDSVTCDVKVITAKVVLEDFIRKSSTSTISDQTLICFILIKSHQIDVIEMPSNEVIESWPLTSVISCSALPIQPAVFPNRYNNVLSVTTSTEVHLFNVQDNDAAQVAEAIKKALLDQKSENSKAASVDENKVGFALEGQVLNRCFDDIESTVNRVRQNRHEYQQIASSKQKGTDKRRAEELASITAKIRPEELTDMLQKVKLALIIVSRIQFTLRPPSATGQQYVDLLLTPLADIMSPTSQFPLSVALFALAKSTDAPLFRKDALMFIQSSAKPIQMEFWKQLGEAWNIPLEEWQREIRPYRPVFRPDNYSPYLTFLDPAIVAVASTDVKQSTAQDAADRPQTPGSVKEETERNRTTYSISSESHPPVEIQELDDVIAAADITENPIVNRTRPMTDPEFIEKVFAQDGRVVRAKSAIDLNEFNVDEGEVFELLNVASDGTFVIKNIFGETDRAHFRYFDEIPAQSSRKVSTSVTSESRSNAIYYSKPLPSLPLGLAQQHKDDSSQVDVTSDGGMSEPGSYTQSWDSQMAMWQQQSDSEYNLPIVSLKPKLVSDDESERLEPVPMKPKPTAENLPLPEKDYDGPPTWLRPGKQNAFAAGIKADGGTVVCVTRTRKTKRAEEISIYFGEILELLEAPIGAWWLVSNAGGHTGYVPLSCLQEMEFVETEPPKPPPETKKTRQRSNQRETKVVAKPRAEPAEPQNTAKLTAKEPAETKPLVHDDATKPKSSSDVAPKSHVKGHDEGPVEVKQPTLWTPLPTSRPGKIQPEYMEHMDRLTGELNSRAATGQMLKTKTKKLLELTHRLKQKRQTNYSLTSESTIEEVRKFLMRCGFTPQLVHEFGSFTGEQLLAMKNLSDFERNDILHPVEVKRLFNLVQGAKAMAGVTSPR